jgi:hypothetical protein
VRGTRDCAERGQSCPYSFATGRGCSQPPVVVAAKLCALAAEDGAAAAFVRRLRIIVETASGEPERGYDTAKKVKGREASPLGRHPGPDPGRVAHAAEVSERDGARELLERRPWGWTVEIVRKPGRCRWYPTTWNPPPMPAFTVAQTSVGPRAHLCLAGRLAAPEQEARIFTPRQ